MPEATLGFDEAEQLLLEAEIESIEPIWSSSNYVFLARLCADGERFSAIYKPLKGETPLWDFPAGLYRREIAAYQFARLLGWPIVPPTVARQGPRGIGSLQVAIGHDPREHFFVLRERDEWVPQLQRMAVFDVAANNADRKGGHCLLDTQGRIWGIDHGLCFHENYKLRSVMWDWAEEPIPEHLLTDLEAAGLSLAAGEAGAAPLLDSLSRSEATALLRRIDALLRERRFPAPGPHRHYPWPLV